MRRSVMTLSAAVVVAALVAWQSLSSRVMLAGPPAEPAAKVAAKAKPKATGAAAPKPADPADNSYCLVCHTNYEEEKLTATHQAVGVGCEKCHGASVKHSGDEDGLTPPDIMYPKTEVTRYCMTCHTKQDLVGNEDHKDLYKDGEYKGVCTDCHGKKHRLKVRTRIWDKKTRKLLSDDGVRMMYKDSPATEGVGPAKPSK